MKNFKNILVFILMLCSSIVFAQQTPASNNTSDFVIVGATAHIGNGNVIDKSIIIVKDGKLQTVVDMTVAKIDLTGLKVINADDKHIYPGFIIPNSTLGLVEIDAVKASDDDSEMGAWNPHIRSLIAYNAESKVVESMRPNGVLLGQITPRGGRVSGTSSIVQFDAWNWEDAAIKTDDGIHLNWPNSFSRGRWWLGEDPGLKANTKYKDQITEISNYFKACKTYNSGKKPAVNLPFEALHGIFNGSKTLYVNVNDEKGITDAVNFSKENGVKKMVIVGGREAYKVTNLLKQNNIAVLLQRVHSRPNNEDDDYDLPFKTAKILTDNGVLVALQVAAGGRMERMNSRNLPFYAGTTVAHGLTKAQALQLITLNPAKILGIDADYGSLESGKSATFFISEGDALDMRTNKITHAYIDGRKISLETHQTKLWKRYSKKYSTE